MDDSAPAASGIPAAAIALVYLLAHLAVATLLPARLAPLSTLCIVLAELAAAAACIWTARRAGDPVRTLWWLVALSILLQSLARITDMVSEAMAIPETNFIPGLQVFLAALDEVPLLLAVSMHFDRRTLRPLWIVNSCLSLAIGGLFYVQIFSLLTLHGSDRAGDARFIILLFDIGDLILAVAATIRAWGADQPEERRFFYVISIFFWANMIFPAIHNRLLVRYGFVWLDLFITTPYLILLVLVSRKPPSFVHHSLPSARVSRMVRSGSPIFLSLGLLLLGMIVSRTHYYLGASGVLAAITGYGILNVLTQSRGLEAEESLLAAKSTLEELVSVDGLTGIPNRRAFDETLERECAAAYRTRRPLSLLMIDVDHFKQLNDALGHPLGDLYLTQIARAIRRALPRAADFAARYGGEEFCVVLPATNRSGAAEVARKLHEAIANLRLTHPSSPSGVLTVSIGLSTLEGRESIDPFGITQLADRALYRAKAEGRNCTRSADLSHTTR